MSFICQTIMKNTVKRALLEGDKHCKQVHQALAAQLLMSSWCETTEHMWSTWRK